MIIPQKWVTLAVFISLGVSLVARGQDKEDAELPAPRVVAPAMVPAAEGIGTLFPINLPTALKLGNVQAIDIQVASEKVRLAVAQLQQARVAWLPTFLLGPSYYRHDGRLQDIQGNVFNADKGAFMFGAGPILIVTTVDGLFGPLVQRRVVQAQKAFQQAAQNDTMQMVADAYFQVQQARGELLGAQDARARAEELVRRTRQLAEVLVPPFEKLRVETEFARRDQAVYLAQQRWRVASAELIRILLLDPLTVVEPLEPPHLQITLIEPQSELETLIRVAMSHRPELRANEALVQAAARQTQREKFRPLMPNVLLRGASTAGVLGTFPMSIFGGGVNSTIGNYGPRVDYDLQLIWELQNLGFGNRSLIRQRQAEQNVASLELTRIQNRVAADVSQAHAQIQMSARRLQASEMELKGALASAQQNLEGLRQTKRVGDLPILIVRPQEVVAAVQALALAYNDYYGAVADYNRAQFLLYRAIGNAAAAVDGLLAPPPPSEAPCPPSRAKTP